MFSKFREKWWHSSQTMERSLGLLLSIPQWTEILHKTGFRLNYTITELLSTGCAGMKQSASAPISHLSQTPSTCGGRAFNPRQSGCTVYYHWMSKFGCLPVVALRHCAASAYVLPPVKKTIPKYSYINPYIYTYIYPRASGPGTGSLVQVSICENLVLEPAGTLLHCTAIKHNIALKIQGPGKYSKLNVPQLRKTSLHTTASKSTSSELHKCQQPVTQNSCTEF